MANIFEGFKNFISKGNFVDLATGIVIGAAFNSVVSSFVRDLLTPLIGAIARSPNFSGLSFTIHSSKFSYGDFLNSLITFLLDAVVIYFVVIFPRTAILSRFAKPKPATTKKCPECLSDIPLDAKRCSHCGQPVR